MQDNAKDIALEQIRRCTDKDIEQLMSIFKTVYRFNPRLQEPDYFNWQFRDSPLGNGDYTFWLLEEEGRITGFIGCIPIELRYNGKVLKGCFSANWFSFSRTASSIKLLNKLILDFDNMILADFTKDTESICEIYNIPVLKELPRWVAIVNPDKVCSLFKISRSDKVRNKFKNCDLYRGTNSGKVSSCGRLDDKEEFLLDHFENIKGYCRKTGKYLNWRYVDIPRHNYQFIKDDQGHFAVYRIENITGREEKVMRLLEWTFKGSSAKDAAAWITQQAVKEGVILMDFFSSAQEVGSDLENLCFFREEVSGSKIPSFFRPLNYGAGISLAIDIAPHRIKRDIDFSQWYITRGDGDIDRIKL